MDELTDVVKPVKILSDNEKKKAEGTAAYNPTIKDVNADPATKLPVENKQDRTRCEILPLGYDCGVFAEFTNRDGIEPIKLKFRNTGKLGAAFTLLAYDHTGGCWFYSLEGAKSGGSPILLADNKDLAQNLIAGRTLGDYHYAAHGPNGYMTIFRGNAKDGLQQALPEIAASSSLDDGKQIEFKLIWPASANGRVKVVNAYTGYETTADATKKSIVVSTKDGWYDVAFLDANSAGSRFLRRYAGHLENGRIGMSDPAIGMKYDETSRVYITVAA